MFLTFVDFDLFGEFLSKRYLDCFEKYEKYETKNIENSAYYRNLEPKRHSK